MGSKEFDNAGIMNPVSSRNGEKPLVIY